MNAELDIVQIMTTQNDLRNVAQVRSMIDYVEAGGFFTRVDMDRYVDIKGGRENPPLISLSEFPDGLVMAHDGHHRLSSIYLAGRRLLRGDEYDIKKYLYEDYTEIHLDNGWMTPFDPITEIRLCEFGSYKKEVRRLARDHPHFVVQYIQQNRSKYAASRDINFIPELADRILTRLELDWSVRHGSGFCLSNRW